MSFGFGISVIGIGIGFAVIIGVVVRRRSGFRGRKVIVLRSVPL